MWRRYCCLTIFSNCRYVPCEDKARQSCAMVRRWRIFGDFLRPAFPASRVQHVCDVHPKFALRPHHPKGSGATPQFLAHICCGQMAAGIKIPVGMEVGLGPGNFVLDGDLAPPSSFPKRGRSPPPQKIGPSLLWPNGWTDQDRSWHGVRPQPTLC